MVAQEPGTASYLASLSLDRAKTWPEFLAAMARWKMPSENMLATILLNAVIVAGLKAA